MTEASARDCHDSILWEGTFTGVCNRPKNRPSGSFLGHPLQISNNS